LPADIPDAVDLHDSLVVGPVASRVADLLGIAIERRDGANEEKAIVPRASFIAELAYRQQLEGDPGHPQRVDGVYLTVPPVPSEKRKRR
jgi:hypothetical protein